MGDVPSAAPGSDLLVPVVLGVFRHRRRRRQEGPLSLVLEAGRVERDPFGLRFALLVVIVFKRQRRIRRPLGG